MYGAKAPRHVFLLDQMLLICKRKEDGTLGYKAHIMVRCLHGTLSVQFRSNSGRGSIGLSFA